MKILKEILLVIIDSFVYLFYEIKDATGAIILFFAPSKKKKLKKQEEHQIAELLKKSAEILENKSVINSADISNEQVQVAHNQDSLSEDKDKILSNILDKPSINKSDVKKVAKVEKKLSKKADGKTSSMFWVKLKHLFSRKVQKKEDITPSLTKKSLFIRITLVSFVLFGTFLVYALWDLPDHRVLAVYEPPVTTSIFTQDGYVMSEYAIEKRSFVPIVDIPKQLKDAFISAEDKNFYSHHGFDFIGLGRAVLNNISYIFGRSSNITGASTITQQVAKNFLLSSDKTIRRKIREAVLTLKIEQAFSKDHILELYLNEIYLGRGSYGVAMASINYFDKPVNDLTLEESAYLAAIPKAPGRYNPTTRNAFAVTRRNWVIGRLLHDGKIDKALAEQAIKKPLIAKERKNLRLVTSSYASEEVRKDLIKKFSYDTLYNGGLSVKTSINNAYQTYSYNALRSGINTYDRRTGYRGAATSIIADTPNITAVELLTMQNNIPLWFIKLNNNKEVSYYKNIIDPWFSAIVITVSKSAITFGMLNGSTGVLNLEDNLWAFPSGSTDNKLTDFHKILKTGDLIFLESNKAGTKWFIRQIPRINGAIVAMNPQNGDILAIQGGYSFPLSEFNRATQALRQPGSAFKPFVYLAALQRGFMTSDVFLDAPFVANNEESDWKPRNSGGSYTGFVTLRYALEWSKNLATIRVGNTVGLKYVSSLSKKIGLYDDDIPDLSGLLGSKEVTLLNLVRAYSVLVNGGKKIEPSLINLVQDKDGNIVYKNDNRTCLNCGSVPWDNQLPPKLDDNREVLVNEQDAFIIVNMMQGVVDRGTGRRARVPGYNIGGKTGTTNEVKDAWFIGFTPDLVVGIYVGADKPVSLGNVESGTSIAVPIFAQFMRQALVDKESLPFRTPTGINMYWVDYKTGYASNPAQSNVILEIFKENQIPAENNSQNGLTGILENGENGENDGIY